MDNTIWQLVLSAIEEILLGILEEGREIPREDEVYAVLNLLGFETPETVFFTSQVPIDEQKQRGVYLPAVDDGALASLRGKGDREDVHGPHPRPPRTDGAQRFLMRILSVGREYDELRHASVLPPGDQVIDESVEGLEVDGRTPRELTNRRRVHAIFYGGRPQHLEFG